MPDREVLPDGTVVIYRVRGKEDEASGGPPRKPFKPREEMEDGSIVLRAVLPEHVISNVLTCLQNEEYDLLWDQMLSEQTKLAYSAEGLTYDDFAAFCAEHRKDMARTLNRMLSGFATRRTVVEATPEGVIVCRFWPQIAQQFRFKQALIAREGLGMKLLVIK